MGESDGALTNKDYLWLTTIHDVLELVIGHCEQAESAQDRLTMGVQLKMASRAMRCALELYRDIDKEKET
jgi:hypothetical protein